MTEPQRRHYAMSLLQAVQASPTLAGLTQRIHASSSRLAALRSVLPAPLHAAIQAGPIDDGQWCLLVSSNAVAAKLRQCIPDVQTHLARQGLAVAHIRIKVHNPNRSSRPSQP